MDLKTQLICDTSATSSNNVRRERLCFIFCLTKRAEGKKCSYDERDSREGDIERSKGTGNRGARGGGRGVGEREVEGVV